MHNTLRERMEKTAEALRKNGFEPHLFRTGAEAAEYIVSQLEGRTVGIGGSMSVKQLGLSDRLRERNTVYWHLETPGDETCLAAVEAQVYIAGANAVSENGYVFNIDGRGNRLAGTLMKKERVFLLAGSNKLAPDADAALERARNTAAPRNSARLEKKTPCAVTGACHDCRSPERICNALLVFWRKPGWCERMDVILTEEELGY